MTSTPDANEIVPSEDVGHAVDLRAGAQAAVVHVADSLVLAVVVADELARLEGPAWVAPTDSRTKITDADWSTPNHSLVYASVAIGTRR